MGVCEAMAKLSEEMKGLSLRWVRVKEGWRDENRRKFEEHYLEKLDAEVKRTQRAMQSIALQLQRARHDCGQR